METEQQSSDKKRKREKQSKKKKKVANERERQEEREEREEREEGGGGDLDDLAFWLSKDDAPVKKKVCTMCVHILYMHMCVCKLCFWCLLITSNCNFLFLK